MEHPQATDYTSLYKHHSKLFNLAELPLPIPGGLDTRLFLFALMWGAVGLVASAAATFWWLPEWTILSIALALTVVAGVYIWLANFKKVDDPFALLSLHLLQQVKQEDTPPDDLRWSVIVLRQRTSGITKHHLDTDSPYAPIPVGFEDRLIEDDARTWHRLGRRYFGADVTDDQS